MSNENNRKISNDSANKEERTSEFSSKWRQVRACARCHRLKMRCAYDDPSYSECKRCFAIGVKCSPDEDPTAQFAKRKRRKTISKSKRDLNVGSTVNEFIQSTDTILASIQRELKKKTPNVTAISRWCTDLQSKSTGVASALNDEKLCHDVLKQLNNSSISFELNLMDEIIFKHKIITIDESKRRFKIFIEEILSYYPIISLSEELKDFNYVFKNQPLFLITCIYATTLNDEESYDLKGTYPLSTLSNYIESFLSHLLFTKSEGFTYQLVYVCLILSIWSLPPKNISNFKRRMPLLMAFSVSLCMNLGDLANYNIESYNQKLLEDSSDERNELRAFLSIYSSCGSLSFALPRFRLVSWTKNHDAAIEALMLSSDGLPTLHDRYLCYTSKIVYLGQEILEFISPNGLMISVDTSVINENFNTNADKLKNPKSDSFTLRNIRNVLSSYERKLYDIMLESGFMKPVTEQNLMPFNEYPREGYILSIVYYHLLMIIYDSLISNYLYYQERYTLTVTNISASTTTEKATYIQSIVKLIKICENLLNSFIKVNLDQTIDYPAFFIFRPMHALILLIRLKLLIKSQSLIEEKEYVVPNDLNINVESYFDSISKLVMDRNINFNPTIRSKMLFILNRISKWMKQSNMCQNKENMGLSVLKIISMSKDQEIENLMFPKEVNHELIVNSKKSESEASVASQEDLGRQLNDGGFPFEQKHGEIPNELNVVLDNSDNCCIEDMFKDIDTEILNFLNPWDSSSTFETFLDDIT